MTGPGERHRVRTALAPAGRARARQRRSLAFFGQLTDPQIADAMSPARVELLDPAGGAVSASWRPQETLGARTFDATIRNLNRSRTSPVKQGDGKRARLGFAITTGDLPDNSQRNETQWMVKVLDGGTVDTFSGKPVSATNQCAGATPEEVAALDADVAARRYTGVQDYDDYPAATPAERRTGFWDPDTAPGGGVYTSFPRYPGLLERALQPFRAEGLKVPWYSSRGNHDGLVQGNAPASSILFRTIVTGCLKIFPSSAFDPATLVGRSDDEVFAQIGDPAFALRLLGGSGRTPPDPDRAFVSKPEYKQLQGTADDRHGFGLTDRAELRASRGTALYYSFSPRRGAAGRARHRRRGRRRLRQRRRPAVPLAGEDAESGGQTRRAGDRLLAPHARDDDEQNARRGGRLQRPDRGRLRRRPAQIDPAPPRHQRRDRASATCC